MPSKNADKPKGLPENNVFEKGMTIILAEKLIKWFGARLWKEHMIHAKRSGYFSLGKGFWKNSIKNRFVFGEVFYLRQCKEYTEDSTKHEVSVVLIG